MNEKLASIDSSVLLGGRWSLQVDKHVNGRIEVFREAGDLIAPSDPPVAVGIERAAADVRIVDDRVNGTLELAASRIGELDGTMQTTLSQRDGNWGVAGSTPLRLQAHASVGSLKPVIRTVREELSRAMVESRSTSNVTAPYRRQNCSGEWKGTHCAWTTSKADCSCGMANCGRPSRTTR